MKSPTNQLKLPGNWHVRVVAADEKLPRIYVWEIEGVGRYVGKYTSIGRTKRYGQNISKILHGLPHHNELKPHELRHIHWELAKAHREGRTTTLTILENEVDPDKRSRRERELIREYGNLNRSGFGQTKNK